MKENKIQIIHLSITFVLIKNKHKTIQKWQTKNSIRSL